MKSPLTLLFPALLAAAPALAQPTSRLAAEWHVPFLTAPEKFALADAASGAVRVAEVNGGGQVSWSPPIPTGVGGVGDTTAGIFGDEGEILALASPSANRVVLLDVLGPAPFPRVLPNLQGLGPTGVSTIGSGPSRELLVASASNGSTAGRLETHADLSGTGALKASDGSTTPFRRLQPITEPGGATVALVSGASGSNTRMELAARSGGNHSLLFKATFTDTVEFATDVRSDHNPGDLFAIGYRSGSDSAQLLEFSTPLSTASTMTSVPVKLPFPVVAVVPIPDTPVGNLADGFLAIAADGSQAAHLRINAAGDGLEPATLTLAAEPGTSLSGLLPIPGLGLVKLGTDAPGGPSTSFKAYQWDGSAWVETDSGALPQLPEPGEIPTTLLFYNENPLADEAARLLGVRHLASWTRRTTDDAVPSDVFAETFASSASGLSSPVKEAVNAPAGTQFVLTNQFDPGASVAAAGNLAGLMAPNLEIDPPSGTYAESFQVAAEYDDSRHTLGYRRDGGEWRTFPENLPVAWSTTLQFTLRSDLDGSFGPILTREYTLPASAIGDADSDNDGVPDYVEQHLGLDPFGGPDADADGVSDLDEILQGTNPLDPTDTPAPNNSAGISPGGGVRLVATALDADGTEIADGEDLLAHGLDGSLIARAGVDDVSPSLPDGGDRGAVLGSTDPQPFDGLVAVRSPLYFDLEAGDRDGREVIGFFPADPPPEFDPAFTPSGNDLATDANGWIAAARSAAANHPLAGSRSLVGPEDSAVAVLLEGLVHAALVDVRPVNDPPVAIDRFTFFPDRPRDEARDDAFGEADRGLFRGAGFDFREALALAESARASMTAAADGIYRHHVANSESSPGIALPVDALRLVLRGDPLPDGYGGAVSSGDLSAARNAYAAALSQLNQTFRPTATWTLEILASPPEPGVYERQSDSALVALLDADGERFELARGLGLQAGSRFSVTGFSDTPPAGDANYPTLEVTGASLTFQPAASDNDQDGNLLDDEWEKFFFGETGQDPDSEPHGGGYTLLQYFLDGTDPRSGELPAGPAVDLSPQLPIFTPDGGGGYTLDFLFPSDYRDQIAFVLERSTSLAPNSWSEVPGVTITPLGGDEFRVTIPPSAAPPGNAFYRIRLSLD